MKKKPLHFTTVNEIGIFDLFSLSVFSPSGNEAIFGILFLRSTKFTFSNRFQFRVFKKQSLLLP